MGFLSLDGTLIVQILNLIVFLVVMNAVFFRPVGKALASRRAYINSVASDYEHSVTEARLLREQAASRRTLARRAVDEQIAAARASGMEEATRITDDYAGKAAALVAAAHARVDGEMRAARAKEADLARDLAATMLDRALGAEQPA